MKEISKFLNIQCNSCVENSIWDDNKFELPKKDTFLLNGFYGVRDDKGKVKTYKFLYLETSENIIAFHDLTKSTKT